MIPSPAPPTLRTHTLVAVFAAGQTSVTEARQPRTESKHGRHHARCTEGHTALGKAAGAGWLDAWATVNAEPGPADGGIRGWHLRRALERAGILRTAEAVDVTAKGYGAAHYAVWPPELVTLLVGEMCLRSVCRTCGEPSRGVVEAPRTLDGQPAHPGRISTTERLSEGASGVGHSRKGTQRTTTGWTSCGCAGTDGVRHNGFHTGPGCRRGLVLDPFGGSGTTGAVATGLGRDCVLIDIDERNVELARQRLGLFLQVDLREEAKRCG